MNLQKHIARIALPEIACLPLFSGRYEQREGRGGVSGQEAGSGAIRYGCASPAHPNLTKPRKGGFRPTSGNAPSRRTREHGIAKAIFFLRIARDATNPLSPAYIKSGNACRLFVKHLPP